MHDFRYPIILHSHHTHSDLLGTSGSCPGEEELDYDESMEGLDLFPTGSLDVGSGDMGREANDNQQGEHQCNSVVMKCINSLWLKFMRTPYTNKSTCVLVARHILWSKINISLNLAT